MKTLLHPTRTVAAGFLLAILVGTLLLLLPLSHANQEPVPWLTALFTAVSAVCVTGLVVVDTGTYWSPFGQVVILALFQLGGFGMMTAATMLGLVVNRSLRLRTKLLTQMETHALDLGDVTQLARVVFVGTFFSEAALAMALALRFHYGYDQPLQQSLWNALFHAVSAFNNAGFSIHEDSLVRYAQDRWVCIPVMVGIVVGGIGFPVLHDLWARFFDPRHWSLHTKLTLLGSGILLVVGFAGVLIFEWSNPRTLGPMANDAKVLAAAFASVAARTAGFNTIDIGALTHESWALHYMLMFIGGGSGGTAGGVKVGTFLVLLLLVVAEIRGHLDNEAFGRRISSASQRQAISVLVLGSMLVTVATIAILLGTTFPTDQVIFEVLSAFGTVGLSTGITADLPDSARLVLIVLMFAGRVGTITVAASLALGERRLAFRYAEEHPLVG